MTFFLPRKSASRTGLSLKSFNVKSGAGVPGTILVHHCNSGLTAEVLPAILQALAERGYDPVPVSALLEEPPLEGDPLGDQNPGT